MFHVHPLPKQLVRFMKYSTIEHVKEGLQPKEFCLDVTVFSADKNRSKIKHYDWTDESLNDMMNMCMYVHKKCLLYGFVSKLAICQLLMPSCLVVYPNIYYNNRTLSRTAALNLKVAGVPRRKVFRKSNTSRRCEYSEILITNVIMSYSIRLSNQIIIIRLDLPLAVFDSVSKVTILRTPTKQTA